MAGASVTEAGPFGVGELLGGPDGAGAWAGAGVEGTAPATGSSACGWTFGIVA